MQPTLMDHLFVLMMLAYFPLDGLRRFEALKRESDAGVDGARRRSYRRIMLEEWGIAILLVAFWAFKGRSWTLLGLGQFSGEFLWIGFTVTSVVLVALIGQFIYASRVDPGKIRKACGALGFMMPHTPAESSWFSWLSVTAGVCEEILYRGFLLAYLGAWMGWPLALLISSLVFGLGHIYQGPVGVLKTGLIGALMGGVVILTGSLWASIVLHALIDWSSGRIGYRAYGPRAEVMAPAMDS